MILDSPRPCPYLPRRVMQTRALATGSISAELYHQFMDANFRRSGQVLYQPVCQHCRACMQIRIGVDLYRPSKSQRRCWRRNQDLTISIDHPRCSHEKSGLYERYLALWHGVSERAGYDEIESFLYASPLDTIEVCYREPGGRLIAIGICDVCPRALSSVYLYFDPEKSRRSLGTFGVMYEIELAKRFGLPHYYLGYWVKGCRSMEYKASFRPCEVLNSEGKWQVPQ